MQFPHRDDAEYFCRVSSNYEGLQSMLHIIIENKLHYEKLYVPFGCMLILNDDIFHGGCMGSAGSFRFNFAIKDQNKCASKRLLRNFDEQISHFNEKFPSTKISGKLSVTDEIEKKSDKVIINVVGSEDKNQHLNQLKRENSKEGFDHLVLLLE